MEPGAVRTENLTLLLALVAFFISLFPFVHFPTSTSSLVPARLVNTHVHRRATSVVDVH